VAFLIDFFWKKMLTIRQYADITDRAQVVERWRTVLGYETAHNEPNLTIEKNYRQCSELSKYQ
jgi:hypothetical protein